MTEPIAHMLDRWWAAIQAGDPTGAVIIVGLWRADVIAAAGPIGRQHQPRQAPPNCTRPGAGTHPHHTARSTRAVRPMKETP